MVKTEKNELLRLENIQVYFPVSKLGGRAYLKAVDDVSFSIRQGETVGLVGESGCGKSTLGKAIVGLNKITGGKIYYHGEDIRSLSGSAKKHFRKNVQMVFQDPAASLNPRMKVEEIVSEPLLFHSQIDKSDRKERVRRIINTVGLQDDAVNRYPHEFSGGQQQRIGIARAIIGNPEFIVCDEAVSALDVSVQAQVLNLLKELKSEYGLTYLFISHNLSVIKHMCDRIVVMYLGRLVEIGTREQIFRNPLHPYTRALISAIPIADADIRSRRIILEGDLPSPINIPNGCPFHTRCVECREDCGEIVPKLVEVEKEHFVSCLNWSSVT